MNLIEESFQDKEEKKKKRLSRILLLSIILVIIIIIAIVSYLMYAKSQVLKLTMDGKASDAVKQLLIFEDDETIYVPIKKIAPYFGYESYSGEYSEKSETQSKCYLQDKKEAINFELGQEKIYKVNLTNSSSDYDYTYMKKPVKSINGELCITTEGLEKAFDISFEYNKQKNTITILTIPYLYNYYKSTILDYGYSELSNELVNQKAILSNQLIVRKDNNKKQYGVIKTDGTVILEPKYDNITYLPNTGDFLVETDKKIGVLSSNSETKIPIIYNDIRLMDKDSGLYLVKQDNKYGVLDVNGNVKIYPENDQIGIDTSKFTKNNIKNKYILANNLIPVKKDKYWALFDKNGKQLTEFKYDSLGYEASSNKDAINLLVIPDYDVLVACKDKKYTLINSAGTELFPIVADDIYMTIVRNEKYYTIGVNDQTMDAIEYLNRRGITTRTNTSNTDENNSTNNNQENNNENEEQENNNQ